MSDPRQRPEVWTEIPGSRIGDTASYQRPLANGDVEIRMIKNRKPDVDEATDVFYGYDDATLLKTFAALTHRLHVADRNPFQQHLALDIRAQRDRVEEEILGRMHL